MLGQGRKPGNHELNRLGIMFFIDGYLSKSSTPL